MHAGIALSNSGIDPDNNFWLKLSAGVFRDLKLIDYLLLPIYPRNTVGFSKEICVSVVGLTNFTH